MANEVRIKFIPDSDKRLVNAIKALDRASKSLTNTQSQLSRQNVHNTRTQKKYNTEVKKAEVNTRILGGTFAVLRSRLLLFNFAMGLGIRQVAKFAVQSAKVESMNRAFNTLSGGTEESSVAFQKLREATDGTMSEFDLFQQANNAMILGVSKNSDEMAEMFDIAQRLGRALGRDTASSVESLITGIGRQSRLMLDNIGIIVKSDEAYASYAEKLNKSVSNLTDAERKQAFLTATMESARAKADSLGKETESTQDAFDRLSSSTANLATFIGKKLNPVTTTLANNLSAIADTVSGANNEEQTREEKLAEKLSFRASLQDNILNLEKQKGIIIKNTSGRSTQALDDEIERTKTVIQNLDMELGLYNNLIFGKNKLNEAGLIESGIQNTVTDNLVKQSEVVPKLASDIALTNQNFSFLNAEQLTVLKGTQLLSNAFAQATLHGQNFGDAVVNSLKAIASQLIAKAGTYALMSMFAPSVSLGSFAKFLFAHTGGYIRDDKTIQRFATGGVVQGEDNVPIMAQAGEFVMSRNAVESIGINNLARMNRTGNAGVTINIQGNMIGNEEFVRDTLMPEINRTVNQGLA
tara:strand:+ start:5516 stop:7258 length:1743 start_codon:yes stop_codon:yes gene_type:complete